jgi:hypothetical protein
LAAHPFGHLLLLNDAGKIELLEGMFSDHAVMCYAFGFQQTTVGFQLLP